MYFTDQLEENMTWLNQALHVDLKNITGLFFYQS